jgi:hypothetical protein
MSDAADADPDDTTDTDDPPEPDLSDEDYAEIDPDLAAKAAEATAEDVADAVDDDEEPTDDKDDTTDDSVPDPSSKSGKSPGTMYCRALGAAAYTARDRAGDGVDDDRKAVIDEYADLAEDLELDEYLDEWWEQNVGGADEMSPGQGLVAMTGMFAAMVVLEDPGIVDGALDAASGGGD